MRIGINLGEHYYPSRKEWLDALKSNGFSALDYLGKHCGVYSPEEETAYCNALKKETREADVIISQTHAPIKINCSEEEFLSKEFFEQVKKSVERTARLEVPYIAVHPYVPQGLDEFINARPYDYSKFIEHNKELNLEFFSRFIPILKETGVKMCIENLFAYDVLLQRHVLATCGNPDEANYYIDQLGDDCFGCCYDSGHLNHFGYDEAEYIRKLGKRIKIVHLNDSWGKDFHGMDWHLMPGQGDVNWDKIANTLKEVGFEGAASFEVVPRRGKLFDAQLKYIGEAGNLIFNT